MKFWIKVVIAFCIVLVIGFAVWAFFFREKDEVVAYNQISEMIEYKESTALSVKLDKLDKMNYLKNDESNIITDDSDTKKEILQIRKRCLSKDSIKVYDVNDTYLFEYDSYYTVDQYTNDFVEYMLPFIDNMEGSSSILRKLKSSKKEYISSLKSTIESIDLVVECQTSIEGKPVEYDVLLGKYKSMAFELRALLNNSANVMNNMLEYFKSAKGGEILTSTYLALNDSFIRTLHVMTGVELISELDYANDLYYVTSKIDKELNGENIFTSEYTELNFLNSYNNLLNKNTDVLSTVFSKKYILKKQMADNDNLSEIPEKLHHNVVVILNVLGY